MSSRACYRYRTAALAGPWRRQADRAIDDAVKYGQARVDDEGRVRWQVNGTIERSECRPDSPCRGIYPPE